MACTRRTFLQQSALTSMLATTAMACSRQAEPVTDIHRFDAVETALRIKNKDITPLDAVEAAITRSETVNPKINAIVTNTFDAARERAAAVKEGDFIGVPTFIKDLADVTGIPTENGSRAFKGFVPEKQYPFIDDFQRAGFVSLGKSTTPEFGLTATTEPFSSGITRNPWNLDYSAGGSSGGAAALVASGAVPIAHASDGGGSIRIPAACCGLVGLKVSRDRFRPVRDERQTPVRISVQGVVSRTVRDTAAFLAAMEVIEPGSSLSPTGLVTGPSRQRLKIGYTTHTSTGAAIHPDVINAIETAAQVCQDLGHDVRPLEKNYDPEIGEHFLLYWAAIANGVVTQWENATGKKATESIFEPFTLGLRDHFEQRRDLAPQAILKLIAFKSAYHALLEGVDLILSPVLSSPPVKIGFLGADVAYETALERLLAYAQFTAPANIAGAASLSLPIATSQVGLPIGVLFNAPVGAERTLLELAFELEEAVLWKDRKPPVFAV